MRTIRFAFAVLFAVLALAAKATDKTDLWWNPSESGWGMTIAHQGSTLFITMYVFGANSQPTWYVGTATFQFTESSGANVYTGTWYSVTGPYYGAVFNPSAVAATLVGAVTYREVTVNTGRITYSVGSTSVTKNVQRQTLQNNPSVYGSFGGGYVSDTTGCINPAINGHTMTFSTVDVEGTPSFTTITLTTIAGSVCTVSGPYLQAGRMGSVTGTFSCDTGASGSSQVFEIEAGNNAISGRVQSSYSGCSEVGYFSGARSP